MIANNETELKDLVPDFQRKARLPSLDETTGNALRQCVQVTEDRLCNREELDKLNLFSYAFCLICQQVIMPQEMKPVYCNLC